MTPASVVDFTYQALMLTLILSLPAVVTAAIVGFVISLLQAVTQIQDQSLGQAAKLIAVGVALVLSGGWMWSEVINFGDVIFKLIATIR